MTTKVYFHTPTIKLEQFLKFSGACVTGGEAKNLILDGRVEVNGEVCLMRGKKIAPGDIVFLSGRKYEAASGDK